MQWSSWLRRTRREPPTLEELQKDYLRQLRLQENVHRLEQEYKAEKLRLAEANQAALLQAPAAAAAGRSRSTDATTAAVDLKAQEGLPADRGGVDEATAAKAPEVARNLGLGQKEDTSASEVTTRDDASGSASASPQELAERRRKQEEADAAKRRADFGEFFLWRVWRRYLQDLGTDESRLLCSERECRTAQGSAKDGAATRRMGTIGASPKEMRITLVPPELLRMPNLASLCMHDDERPPLLASKNILHLLGWPGEEKSRTETTTQK